MRSNAPNLFTDDEDDENWWIQAWKSSGHGGFSPAEGIDDPEAIRWTLQYPGQYDPQSRIEFEDKYFCREILKMVRCVFNAGGERKLEHLRRYLGVKE